MIEYVAKFINKYGSYVIFSHKKDEILLVYLI